MDIKFSFSVFLQKTYHGNTNESQIRLRIHWKPKNSVIFNVGYSIHPDKWNNAKQEVRNGCFNKKGSSSYDINKETSRLKALAHDVFKKFELEERIPNAKEYRDSFNAANGKTAAMHDEQPISFYITEFCQREGGNKWSDGTLYKFHTLSKHLEKFKKGIRLSDINEKTLEGFHDYLVNAGLQNTTVNKDWKIFYWFLRWADDNSYLKNKDYTKFNPKLKTVKDKTVIFLTWEELMKLYEVKFPEDKSYLEHARDVFCFQSFTSLRYSDVAALKWEDIDFTKGEINIVTQKTGKHIPIDLNKYSRSILDKYKGCKLPLPVQSNQKMNLYIKEACYIAGIDKEIHISYFKGSERIDEVKKKYELIGTHSARRTFICAALPMGISPAIVMEWTGHSNYSSMRPYISVSDKERKEQMKKFDDR